ncbi:helix-turn-helix domain-containing protein [Ralstonia mojiangensis]|uniref:helix-turn-helix domain-containing protein n=1 Tax=Ralstonia mojiangensis TaxID=2953895 RepID=UPI002091863A|nr:helix-turn-helix transcriptional regulator [Ralstonia mojiangensis]MCO5410785.1 helix-turn-helix domain-containing protein [Ralstonia mojiangensis]
MGSRTLHFGERLAEERLRLGLSQAQMAALGGVALRTYSNYETGTSEPGVRILANWHKAGADALYLVTGQHVSAFLSPEEDVLIAGIRRLDARGRAGVLALIGGLSVGATEAQPVKAGKRSQIIVGGSNNVQVGAVRKPAKGKAKRDAE